MSPPPIPPDPPDTSHHESGQDLAILTSTQLTNPCADLANANEPTVDDPGLAKNTFPVDEFGLDRNGNVKNSTIVTLDPFVSTPLVPKGDKAVLHVHSLSLDMSYGRIHEEFAKFGPIRDIRVRLSDTFQTWTVWISFELPSDAEIARTECAVKGIDCELLAKAPSVPDVYFPPSLEEMSKSFSLRSPRPARWLIVSSTEERANSFSFRRFLKQELGSNNISPAQITRFGRSSFLVHACTDVQDAMIFNLKRTTDNKIREVKPHFDFSYAKGVIFHRDLHDFSEEEILDMCPSYIWKVFKVPRSSMIVLTFTTDNLRTQIDIEKEIIYVKPYRPKPLQCFSCYGYGHSSKRCTREKICCICAHPLHGDCDRKEVCVNCKGGHSARSRECGVYKKEEKAVLKAHAEHISVGHAKYLIAKTVTYSDKVKSAKPIDTVPVGNKLPSENVKDVYSIRPKPQRSPRRTRLSPKDLSVNLASQSSEEASRFPISKGSGDPSPGVSPPHSGGVVQASLEASQACSLPDLGDTPMENVLNCVPHVVEVHHENVKCVPHGQVHHRDTKPDKARVKRVRTPSPPQSPTTRVPSLSRRSSSLDRPREPKDKKKRDISSSKPNLNRPLQARPKCPNK